MIVKVDAYNLTLLQFVAKDAAFSQPRLTISEPGHMEDGVYYPPESIMLYGADTLVKLYHFLGECVSEAELIKQAEMPFVREIARRNVEGEKDDNKKSEQSRSVPVVTSPVLDF